MSYVICNQCEEEFDLDFDTSCPNDNCECTNVECSECGENFDSTYEKCPKCIPNRTKCNWCDEFATIRSKKYFACEKHKDNL